MAQSKPEQLAHRAVEDLWNDGKPESIDELYADAIKLRIPGRTLEGRDGVRQFIGMYHEAFPDLHIEVRDYFVNEDESGGVMHWTFHGTHEGNLMGLEATGNEVSVDGMTLTRYENDKAIEEVVLWDRLEQFRQLGVSPEDVKPKA